MKNIYKDQLIQKILGSQEIIYDLMTEYDIEDWLKLDITSAQLKCLVYLHDKGRVNFRELADALRVTPSVVTGIIDRLVAQEMVCRTASLDDRRVQWLSVTDKGRDTLQGIKQKASKEIPLILRNMSVADLTALVQGLNGLVKSIEASLMKQSAGDPAGATCFAPFSRLDCAMRKFKATRVGKVA